MRIALSSVPVADQAALRADDITIVSDDTCGNLIQGYETKS